MTSVDEYNAALPIWPVTHPERGTPVITYKYYDTDRRLVGINYYFRANGMSSSATLAMNGLGWVFKPLPVPAPIYNLADILDRPNDPVAICDSERAAMAAAELLPGHACAAWQGRPQDTDWTRLKDRYVLIWPAVGDIPRAAAKAVHALIRAAGGHSRVLAPMGHDGDDATTYSEEGWTTSDVSHWLTAQRIGEPHVEAMPDQIPAQTDFANLLQLRIGLGLDLTAKGEAVSNINNAMLVLERHREVKDIVWYDEFLQRIMTDHANPREWKNADDVNLCLFIQRNIGCVKISLDSVRSAVIGYAYRHMKHCVRDWFETLKWDGLERIANFFPDNYGAKDTAYSRAVSKNFWVGMAARIYRPGCQLDNMVVLEGEQGVKKSKSLRIIGKSWFTQQHESVTGKGFFEVLQGKLLVEIGEMDAFTKGEVSKVKDVISCPTDRFRVPWDRHAEDHPRQCTFVATTNTDDWNRDPTGARRFWPIKCEGEVDVDNITRSRDQLFAEAIVAFKAGDTWYETPEAETKAEQRKRFIEDVWIDQIGAFVGHRSEVSTSEVLADALGVVMSKQGKAEQMRVGTCLKLLQWTRHTAKRDGRSIKVWRNPAFKFNDDGDVE